MQHRLIGNHHEVGGPPADIHHRDGGGEAFGLELHALVRLADHLVVPGGQGLWDYLVEGDGRCQAPIDGLHRLLEAVALALQGTGPLAAVLELELTPSPADRGGEGFVSDMLGMLVAAAGAAVLVAGIALYARKGRKPGKGASPPEQLEGEVGP